MERPLKLTAALSVLAYLGGLAALLLGRRA
jgi:hypothetical protein